jgi:hypothetical protein
MLSIRKEIRIVIFVALAILTESCSFDSTEDREAWEGLPSGIALITSDVNLPFGSSYEDVKKLYPDLYYISDIFYEGDNGVYAIKDSIQTFQVEHRFFIKNNKFYVYDCWYEKENQFDSTFFKFILTKFAFENSDGSVRGYFGDLKAYSAFFEAPHHSKYSLYTSSILDTNWTGPAFK